MKQIGPFKLYEKKPNDICYGSIYTTNVVLPLLYYPKRTIRVFLPEDYDEKKTYKVLIMSDGQNIVDKYTSAFGAWEIDKKQHELLKEGYPSFIVVGIDCPVGPLERAIEYSFPFIKLEPKEEGVELSQKNLKFESHLLYEYIASTLLPLLRKHFPISNKREDVGVAGSSMGGVFALSMLLYAPKEIGFALSFSPGFFLYTKNEVEKYVLERLKLLDQNHKIFFYSGNVGFEAKFLERTKDMYELFIENGFNKHNVDLLIDLDAEHCEAWWSAHFNDAIRFVLAK